MLCKEFGAKDAPCIVLLHGGGLSWWSWLPVIRQLENDYRVLVPVIDGYGEASGQMFISIEHSASEMLSYLQTACGGRVYALAGLSIGAQIVVEMLSQQDDIAEYAVIESALVCPMRCVKQLTPLMVGLSFPLIRMRWFARLQARELCVPQEQFDRYYADSQKISKASLQNTMISNSTYALKDTLGQTTAKALIIVGEHEIGVMKKSARQLQSKIAESQLYIAPRLKHGELSLVYPEDYVKRVKAFFVHSEVTNIEAVMP